MKTSTLSIHWVPTSTVHLSPSNPRNNDAAVPHVAASLQRFGWQQPIVARPSGEVIAGNTRLKAALSLEMTEVPVVWFDGSDLEVTAFAIADNRTHEFAEWDLPSLTSLLSTLRTEDSLAGVGFDDTDVDQLLAELEQSAPEEVKDPGPGDPPANPVTRPGDLWVLGRHRLLCGDSTNPDDVALVMDGATADLLATDPPYLVNYRGGNHPPARGNRPGTREKHWDDYEDPATGQAFYEAYLAAALPHCREDVSIYQWHAHRRQALVEAAWTAQGLLVHQQLIWVKSRAVLTRSHYMWQHEPCFYGWRQGHQPATGRRPEASETTVWTLEHDPDHGELHPTQKPVELFARPIRAHTVAGGTCLEPFCGSGTQLIAAQTLGRSCRAIEQSPAYVDVAVDRWQRATGQIARLAGTDLTFGQAREARGNS